MDQKTHEMAKQNVLDFKCKKILPVSEKSSSLSSSFVKKHDEPNIVCETPEKINEPLQKKFQEGQVKIPENCGIITEFFDHMHCSLRLLGLCKKLPTFENVSAQMEVLAKRKFLYKHLAQMKYILPEALKIEKILIHDKRTLCMKSDVKISLVFDVVEGHAEVSDFIALSKVFSLRLNTFFAKHPEATDVPEAFNKRSLVTFPDELRADSTETEILSEIFVPSPVIRRHFSKNAAVAEKEKIPVLVSDTVPPADILKEDSKSEKQEEFNNQFSLEGPQDTKSNLPENSPATCFESIPPSPQLQQKNPQCSHGSRTDDSPLVKAAPSDDSFMIQTPLPSIPRRLVTSCDNNQKTMSGQSLALSCKPAKRVLDFYQSEGDENMLSLGADMPRSDQVVYGDISRITKGVPKDVISSNSSALPQEEIDGSTCQDISSCLDDKVALIHSLFKSINFSPITKEELTHKIIMNSLDIVEKREVEELLDLLERHVPDWIYKNLVPSGDILYNIKEFSDLGSVQAKLTSF